MIVLKFGGSSVSSPAAIKRVAGIVQSQLDRKPVVIVSAIGDVTDQLVNVLKRAGNGESYLCWNLIKDLIDRHCALSEELLGSKESDALNQQICQTFRELQVRMMEACQGESVITPEESDRTLSIGEQLSSLLVSAAFRQLGIPTRHLDSRHVILTDNQFTQAKPRFWETYAKLRWSVPLAAQDGVIVAGGFIGATEDGRTTTLGRGGSDLTATIFGAAINAEEIQIWKDVDGILTADPRLKPDALLVQNLCYDEAAELAKAGAQALHPETIAPAQRLRIPIVLRNTFAPQSKGTLISAKSCRTATKSIVCQTGITVLAISPGRPGVSLAECSDALNSLLVAQEAAQEHVVKTIGMSDSVLYLAVDSAARQPDLIAQASVCFEAQLRTDQVILTIIGDALASGTQAFCKTAEIVQSYQGFILPRLAGERMLRAAIPHQNFAKCLSSLHELFFAQADPDMFAKCSVTPAPRLEKMRLSSENRSRESRLRLALALVGGNLNRKPLESN